MIKQLILSWFIYKSRTKIKELYGIEIFTLLQLCHAAATHNFKWVKIIYKCTIWIETYAY